MEPGRPARRVPAVRPWWYLGALASAPAVLLWMLARMPAGWLALFPHDAALPLWLNRAGDALFVAGWLASAASLWRLRKRVRRIRQARQRNPASPQRRHPLSH
jgi:hypothetical protein